MTNSSFMRIKIPLIFAILIVVVFLGYANTLHSPFQFDDAKNVVNDHSIRDLYNFTKVSSLRYRHITSFSFASNYYLGKLNPFGYHLFNLLLHVCATILVFLITIMTLEKSVGFGNVASIRTAFVAALCFTLNPVFSEAITYVSGRATSLSAVFCLMSWYFFILGSLRRTGLSLSRIFLFIISLAFLFVAVLAKETAVILPLALLLYDVCFIRKECWIGWKTRFFCYYAIIPVLAIIFVFKSKASVSLFGWWLNQARSDYALAQIKVIAYAIKLFFFPVNLAIEYNSNYTLDWSDPAFTAPVLFFTAIILLAIKNIRAMPVLTFPILWMMVTISPTNSFIPREDLLSERNLYLPFIGMVLFVAMGFNSLRRAGNTLIQEENSSKRHWQDTGPVCAVVMLVLLTIYSTLLIARNSIYQTPLSFWEDTYEKAPNKLRVLHNLSLEYMRLDDREKTYATLSRMLAIDPFNYFARINLANIHMNNGETARAVREFEDLAKRNPDTFEPYFNLGSYYASEKNFQKAKEYYELALKRDDGSKNKKSYYYLAKVCFELGFWSEAEGNAMAYMELVDPSKDHMTPAKDAVSELASSQNLLALIYVRQGKVDQGISAFEKSLSLNPKDVWAHVNLANYLIDEKRGMEKALLHLKQALALINDSQQRELIKGRISDLDKEGDTSPAVMQFEDAILRDPESSNPYVNMGEYYISRRLFQKAKEYLVMAQEKKDAERNKKLVYCLAKLNFEMGLLREAEGYATRYVEMDDSVYGKILLADIFVNTEREYIAEKIYRVDMNKDLNEQAIAQKLLALLYTKQKKIDQAITAFEKFISLSPKDIWAHVSLANLLIDEKRGMEKALLHFKLALALTSDSQLQEELKISISALNKDVDVSSAARKYEEAVLRDPESAEPYINAGEYYAGQGFFQKAKEYFAMAVEKNGVDKNPNLLFYQARAYLELGQFREAELAVRTYLFKVNSKEWEPSATDMEKYILLAEILIALERYGEVDSIVWAFMNVGYLPPAHYIKGLLSIKLKNKSGAIAEFEESIKLNPKDARPHMQLGKLLQNKPEVALQHLNQALALNSDLYLAKLINNMISKMYGNQERLKR